MKQFAIIGLGNFGFYLAKHLYRKGYEVLAVDIDPKQVQAVRDDVSQAIVADATDRTVIEALGVKDMDVAVVCIGSILSNSILATLILKDIGVKRIYAKAITEPHGRILFKVGADEVFFPEKDMAISLAERLHNPNMLDYLPFLEGYSIIELVPPRGFIGKNLKDLNLTNRFGVQVVAIKEMVPDKLNLIPTAQSVLKESDIMIILGPNEGLDKLQKIEL
ncbi:MAG: TrkA family potassium uptake protein [Desulfobacterales bacterium]|nr:TrkA family potassium uptake protein [Desulfobacterales bacterium]